MRTPPARKKNTRGTYRHVFFLRHEAWLPPDGHHQAPATVKRLFALFLFSDVSLDDAPMGMLPGSHLLVPRALEPHGRAGTGGDALVRAMDPRVLCRQASYATGDAGDVYLCHPFLIHTGTWPHRGATARLAANLKIEAEAGFTLDGSDPSPVARAIVAGLAD